MKNRVKIKSIHSASFRDPSGFLFSRNGILYRQVNEVYREDYDHLMSSGLYQTLVDSALLIPHDQVNVQPELPSLAACILQPTPIPLISYPYEWCFSQLQDAALTTLDIHRTALQFGMSLKDASAYNIQFFQGKPILLDTLSFERYQEGQVWVAYRQFCQHFLAPLALMAFVDVRLNQLMRVYIDGLPLDLASKLLPLRTRASFGLLTHIHVHATAQKRYSGATIDREEPSRQISKTSMLGLIDNLESSVRKLRWIPGDTPWSDYYQIHNYENEAMAEKMRLVGEYIEETQPRSVWDLGANIGVFSRLSSQKGIDTYSFDIDPSAVEANFRKCREEENPHLLPLLVDLTNPSPAIGWENRERLSFSQRSNADMVLALALIHHLAITNNLPLDKIASFFAELAPWLIIEFIPKADSQVQKLLASRVDIFETYTLEDFELIFSNHFEVVRREQITSSLRSIYLMKTRS